MFFPGLGLKGDNSRSTAQLHLLSCREDYAVQRCRLADGFILSLRMYRKLNFDPSPLLTAVSLSGDPSLRTFVVYALQRPRDPTLAS